MMGFGFGFITVQTVPFHPSGEHIAQVFKVLSHPVISRDEIVGEPRQRIVRFIFASAMPARRVHHTALV